MIKWWRSQIRPEANVFAIYVTVVAADLLLLTGVLFGIKILNFELALTISGLTIAFSFSIEIGRAHV